MPVEDSFACHVFGPAALEKYLPNSVFQEMRQIMDYGKPLPVEIADIVAEGMKEWALDQGATHYTHWFQPMTGITAEKHDAFIQPAGEARVLSRFKGKELITGEPDASSFPNGGLRATFEARGYTAWDPTSFAFVRDKTLYIPTLFVSYDGLALDKKTPLLRSLTSLHKAARRLLEMMGYEVKSITTNVGPEQEYFLIDEKYFQQRLDLQITGRTLFGAGPVKGQELDDHYFGSIPARVKQFMEDVNQELWSLGVYAKTEHKEVAPCQFELAPIYSPANLANDQNQLTMEVLQRTARKHHMVCLLHEKPFAGINGSGKHNNWSLTLNGNDNLLEPGENPADNLRFLVLLAAIIKGVDEYQDLLRLSVATPGNDHRLGAQEAPPAIISIFLGEELSAILKAIADHKDRIEHTNARLDLGVSVLPSLPKDTSDRNRTSPFAFTGNKFEFRMLGSSLNISCPNTILNTIVAEELDQFADELEAWPAEQWQERLIGIVRQTIKNHSRILFAGDGYTDGWRQEAARRGLLNDPTSPDALIHYTDPKNITLFVRHNVYSPQELHARQIILLENYAHILSIEARTMVYMTEKDILPALALWQQELLEQALNRQKLGMHSAREQKKLKQLDAWENQMEEALEHLKQEMAQLPHEAAPGAFAAKEKLLPAMEELRKVVDALETSIPRRLWPLPDYNDILFQSFA